MPLYKPRMQVKLYVPNVGEPSQRVEQEGEPSDVTGLDCRCLRARITSNSHNEADEAEVELAYDDAGVDPRLLRNAEVYVYIDDELDEGSFSPTSNNLRFLGIACEVERSLDVSSGKRVKIRALDYTTLFINAKNYPASGIPSLSMTLTEAWNLVCDSTGYYDLASLKIVSTVQRFKDRLAFVGLDGTLVETSTDPGLTLGKAVGARLAKLGKLQVKQGSDAWAVWQTAVGSLGLITFIRGDRCIVTTMTDFYSSADPPRMIFGTTVRQITETRDVNGLSSKNVGIESFDPLTGQTVEAFYPPLSLAMQKKKLGASANGPAVGVQASDYEIFDCHVPTSDPAVLALVAQRVWEERSRQELTGKLVTAEMFTPTLSGASFDLLSLQAGDRVRVELDPSALSIIQGLPTTDDRIGVLVALGYSDQMAEFLTANIDQIGSLTPEFQVRSVTVSLDVSQAEGGSFEITIDYCNRIDVSGSAQAGTGGSTKLVA